MSGAHREWRHCWLKDCSRKKVTLGISNETLESSLGNAQSLNQSSEEEFHIEALWRTMYIVEFHVGIEVL
jgi:hypothetical protein